MGWVVPVGTPGGVNSGLGGVPAGAGIVRLGSTLFSLDLDMYRLWRAAAAAPQVDDLVSWATGEGISDVADRVQALETSELLIGDGPDVQLQIGRLALRLIGECLGNGTGISPAFMVLGRNRKQLQVDSSIFEMLLYSDGVRSVLAACETLDAGRPHPGSRARIETLAEGLPMLVRNEVVLLEAAVR